MNLTIHTPHCPGESRPGVPCAVPLPPSQPRIFKGGKWWCPDCIYRQEVKRDAKPIPPKQPRPKHPQKETLL